MFNFPLAPPQASNFAYEHDLIFYTLCGLTLLFSLLVGVFVIYFAIKYRAGNKVDRSRPMYENLRLELTWTIVPLILGLIMFFFGARLFVDMRTPPKDAQEIFIIGKQWMWHVQHSNGVRENNTLHVPVGKPIKLTMISQDVIHAFYIPAFRTQMHVVPGRYTTMWFTPTKAGEYHLFCGMYCGTQHSEMGGKVVAMEQRDFTEWLANGGNSVAPMSMAQTGEKIYNRLACNNCHGAQNNLRAPSLYGLAGRQRRLANGSTVVADDAYIRESILRPWNKLTAGYDRSMPAYEGQISEEEVLNLIAYIKSMTTSTPPSAESTVNSANAVTAASGADSGNNNAIAWGAMGAQQERTDATPTTRNRTPAVGAIAAQESESR